MRGNENLNKREKEIKGKTKAKKERSKEREGAVDRFRRKEYSCLIITTRQQSGYPRALS